MDKEIRNKIKKMVQDARKELLKEIGELLEGVFGLHKDGTIEDISRLPQIKDDQNAIKAREGFAYVIERETAVGSKKPDAVERLVLGLTFTHMNRLVAMKLMERRKVIRETVSRGSKSNGFVHYVVDVLKKTDLSQLEDIDIAYQDYILYQCREVAEEIKVLFDPEDLSSYVFPRPRALKAVLEIINNPEIDNIWDFDETIGWFYQYFTPKEIREQARAESSAPRNSWELAFRNQFYTPRYVVQFLADNTLGRTWYEMMQGNTMLAETCEYMVKPKNEVFLQKNEKPAAQTDSFQVPFREKKDPRLLKILDPACGSGHFLLYVFNLLMIIYREAYGDKDLGVALQKDYPDKEAFEREIPRLILENNLYGIDIDLRAIQIAALALWLMAQREWIKIRREDRPRIRYAHLVCAEPMPGNQKLFEDFISTLKPALLGDLVRNVWEKMKLAGEAGSLLQIEQELRSAIHDAKQKWKSLPRPVQLTLFGKSEPGQLSFALSEIKDEAFFKEAEEKVFSALRDYAEKVKAENHGYSRRLFAEESIRGFQFIEVLQNRFDVVLMNPPYGDHTIKTKEYLQNAYSYSSFDIYSCFYQRTIELLLDNGMLGALTSRTFITFSSFSELRKFIMENTTINFLADLGLNVLDNAIVETCAIVTEKVKISRPSIFYRLLKIPEKSDCLLSCIHNSEHKLKFIEYQKEFLEIPNNPLSYWAAKELRHTFKFLPSFESVGANLTLGLVSADNERYLRLRWEVLRRKDSLLWPDYCKGGDFSKYYDDPHLVIDWRGDGKHISESYGEAVRLRNTNNYFRAGVNYPLITNLGMNARVMYKGCIFDNAAPTILCDDMEELWLFLALVNTRIFEFFVRLLTSSRHWQVGYLRVVPFPEFDIKIKSSIKLIAQECFNIRREWDSYEETSHCYKGIFSYKCGQGIKDFLSDFLSKWEKRLIKIHENSVIIDKFVTESYKLNPSFTEILGDELDYNVITYALKQLKISKIEHLPTLGEIATLSPAIKYSAKEIAKRRYELPKESRFDYSIYTNQLISYAIGCIFGRWDIRMYYDKSLVPELAGPFDPLPVCSPGMLLSPDGCPATSGRIVSEAWLKRRVNVLDVPTEVPNPTIADKDYPIQVDWDGILVDDEGHSDDIVKKVHEVLALIYGEHADEREREILEILDIKSLRDYFRQPKRFFDFHIKRYSKSRRKAPIYWLLQTKKKNYGICLYYHRLDNDTLFKILRNYVEPKLNLISSQILEASQKVVNTDGRDKLTYEKELEKLEELRQEITEFKEELEKVAKMGYDPNFDDGVILNMAPLHTVIPWSEPQKYWKDLESGKYDWAHIAMKYWPERVKAKCKKDKSLAIAHGYE